MIKQIPYGLTDFGRIQKENYYYVDKTMFIEKIEMQPSYLFLIRPRRFGKSLTLAMLEAYYDVRYADQFDELFGHLYIGQHPTPIHNQFLIMRFNFSEVSSNVNEVEESFRLHCCGKLSDFVYRYEHLLGKDIWNVLDEKTQADPGAFLSSINTYATRKGDLKIYLLIDEYDNFTNTILSTYGTDLYRKATHGEGYIRRFFNVIKAATTGMGSAVNRLFITGVSPVTMDDVTSGFNMDSSPVKNSPRQRRVMPLSARISSSASYTAEFATRRWCMNTSLAISYLRCSHFASSSSSCTEFPIPAYSSSSLPGIPNRRLYLSRTSSISSMLFLPMSRTLTKSFPGHWHKSRMVLMSNSRNIRWIRASYLRPNSGVFPL